MFLFRMLVGRVIGLAVLLLVLAVAGWWFLIREDNAVQTDAAEVTDDVRAAAETARTPTSGPSTSTQPADSESATPAATPADGGEPTAEGVSTFNGARYQLVPGQALAWYLAPEKLSRLPTSSVARGETTDVTGEFHVSGGQLDPERPTTFTVGVDSLQSDEGMRDRRMRDALQVSQFPEATFIASSITGLPESFTATDSVMQLTGTMDLHGVQRELTWELKVKESDGILSILATTAFDYRDFGITKPEVAGFVTVDDEVTIQVQLFAAPVV